MGNNVVSHYGKEPDTLKDLKVWIQNEHTYLLCNQLRGKYINTVATSKKKLLPIKAHNPGLALNKHFYFWKQIIFFHF